MEPGCAGRVLPLQKVILHIWYIYCWRSRTSDMISWLAQQFIYLLKTLDLWIETNIVTYLKLTSKEIPNQQNYPIECKINNKSPVDSKEMQEYGNRMQFRSAIYGVLCLIKNIQNRMFLQRAKMFYQCKFISSRRKTYYALLVL